MSGTLIQEKVSDKITKALDGRTQVALVEKIKEYAETMEDCLEKELLLNFSDVKLSRRMNGRDDFKPHELKAIAKVLKIKLL